MGEYKCINCGAVIQSEKKCQCPKCGYTMFETPYDRKDKLRSEIVDFVGQLKPTEMRDSYLDYFSKKNHKVSNISSSNAFPGFDKILGYICSAEKTEEFHERLNESIDEIRKHCSTPFSMDYKVEFSALRSKLDEYDGTLKKALDVIGLEQNMPDVIFPEADLTYSETPDTEILDKEEPLFDLLFQLSDKIIKFIKLNNIYGISHNEISANSITISKSGDYLMLLDFEKNQLKEVVGKKYIVDIFSDGTDELKEMLEAVWHAIGLLLTVPVLKKDYQYHLSDGATISKDEIKRLLLQAVLDRYEVLGNVIYADDFLNDKSEDELLDFYGKMIELDNYGIIGFRNIQLLKSGESEKKLEKLIGLESVKENIKKIKAFAMANSDSSDLNLHMCFYGNPGSGKTEVARIIAGILHENKILPTDKVVEVDRGGLISQYVGETPQKTMQKVEQAMGGVLFVDEAYALVPEGNASGDYGYEAVATLIKAMEDYRGKFCVILAGYKNEMQKMLSSNPGFKSRIQFYVDFPNYSRKELEEIAGLMLEQKSYVASEDAMDRMLDITDIKRKDPYFANAREIRNILDQVIMCQNLRCMGTDNKEIELADVNKYIKDTDIKLPTTDEGAEKKLLSGDDELDQLVGLSSVKKMVKKIRAYAKKNKGDSEFNMHMCFYGNPGTGKTEVARIISRILYEAGVLGEAKLVETDAHGLLGSAVGETAPKTQKKIDEAEHGVLFIDEAYGLVSTPLSGGASSTYGDDAIAVLLKEMEDRRGDFCVILAGYKDEMKKMISTNPGLASRIQFILDFPDYTREELGEIGGRFLNSKGYEIESDALERVLDITEYYRARPNFANARTLRNIMDQVIMNQNLRTEDNVDDKTVILQDVEDYLEDEEIDLSKKADKRTIGF